MMNDELTSSLIREPLSEQFIIHHSSFIILRHPRPSRPARVRRRPQRGHRTGAGSGRRDDPLRRPFPPRRAGRCSQLSEEFGLPAAVGIHPNSTAEAAPGDWEEVVAMAGRPGVAAIGETGLDRYRDFAPLEAPTGIPRPAPAVGPAARPAGDSPLPRRPGRLAADAPRGGGPRPRCGACCTPSAARRSSPPSVWRWVCT